MIGVETPESIVRPYLREKERILWTGRPAQGLRFTSADIFLVPFSLLWGGFAIFWEFGVIQAVAHNPGEAGFFPLFGIPFVAVGLFLIAGRFYVDAWIRTRSSYALTDRRAIIVRRTFGEQIMASGLDESVRLKRRKGQTGDIEFGYKPALFAQSQGFGFWIPALAGQVSFLGIPDAMDVYRLIQKQTD